MGLANVRRSARPSFRRAVDLSSNPVCRPHVAALAQRQAEAHLRKGAEVAAVLQRIYDNAFAGDQQAIERWKEARRVGPARSVEPPTAQAPTAAAAAAPPATAKTA